VESIKNLFRLQVDYRDTGGGEHRATHTKSSADRQLGCILGLFQTRREHYKLWWNDLIGGGGALGVGGIQLIVSGKREGELISSKLNNGEVRRVLMPFCSWCESCSCRSVWTSLEARRPPPVSGSREGGGGSHCPLLDRVLPGRMRCEHPEITSIEGVPWRLSRRRERSFAETKGTPTSKTRNPRRNLLL
jgi:hypothetical protein